MTKFSKVLAVLLTVFSLAFLGTSAVAVLGGPNWVAKTEQLNRDHSLFFESKGPDAGWDVKVGKKDGPEAFTTGKTLAAAIVAAQKKINDDLKPQIEDLDKQIAGVSKRTEREDAAIKTDAEAIERRLKELEEQLAKSHEQVNKSIAAVSEKSAEVKAIQEETVRRRDERTQLETQLDVVRAQRESANRDRQRLNDLLIQTEGTLERAVRRQQILELDGAKPE